MVPTHVLVAGGGFAAAEALLALRALAGERISIELLTPDLSMPLRPAATALGAVPEYDLRALAESVGASVRVDRLESVAPQVRRARPASGGTARYDALVLALGARARVAVPGAVTFRDQRDAGRVAAATEGAERLVVAVPAGVTWSLPAYELALRASAGAEVTVVTPERAPLEVFGAAASAAVAARLGEHGVRVLRGSLPREATAAGLRLSFGGLVEADAVVALPELAGRRLAGIPAAFGGFVPTGPTGRVDEAPFVWAVGDMTTFPLKQGGIATQQADRAAADIAGLPDVAGPLVLRARLDTPSGPLYLRSELGPDGRALETGVTTGAEPPWWPDAKVCGRHLTPWMADQALV